MKEQDWTLAVYKKRAGPLGRPGQLTSIARSRRVAEGGHSADGCTSNGARRVDVRNSRPSHTSSTCTALTPCPRRGSHV